MELEIIFQLFIFFKLFFTIECSIRLEEFEIFPNSVMPNGAATYTMEVKEKCKFKIANFYFNYFVQVYIFYVLLSKSTKAYLKLLSLLIYIFLNAKNIWKIYRIRTL